jgi:hypothetical protein
MFKIYLICDELTVKLKMIYPILKYLHNKDFILIKEKKILTNFFEILKDYKDYKDYFFYFYTEKKLNIKENLKQFLKLDIQFGIINKNSIFLINFPKKRKLKQFLLKNF